MNVSEYDLIRYIKRYLIYTGFVPSYTEIGLVLGIDNVKERLDKLAEKGIITYIDPDTSETKDCYKVAL